MLINIHCALPAIQNSFQINILHDDNHETTDFIVTGGTILPIMIPQ